jgi:hypothetical protein
MGFETAMHTHERALMEMSFDLPAEGPQTRRQGTTQRWQQLRQHGRIQRKNQHDPEATEAAHSGAPRL